VPSLHYIIDWTPVKMEVQLIIDLRRAIDLLGGRPDVDPQRIAYLGVSYGGAMGGLLAGDEAIMDNAKWLQQFIGPGALFLVPTPNYGPSAVVIDRLVTARLSLTVISLAFLSWNIRHQDDEFLRRNVKWFILVAPMAPIGLAVYIISQRSARRIPKPQ
jgi:hypothetical protein